MSTISLKGITKVFSKTIALNNFSFDSINNEFVIVVGPSGCGKSTLLSIIAGLEKPTSGEVFINGRDITKLPPNERDISIVFQNYALYPNMTVFDNLAFPLSVRKYDKKAIKELVEEVAEKLEISPFLKRKPKTLSGGQRQRVAIGRAMIRNPNVYLLDEPLSNLDASLREKMREELIRLHNSVDAVFVYVTHDQVEALSMADRIIVLNEGIIQQVGTPDEVYNQPENLFVAKFLGSPKINLLTTKAYNNIFNPKKRYSSDNYYVGVRPENIILNPNESNDCATITLVEMLGKEYSIHLQVGTDSLIVSIPAHSYNAAFQCGNRVKCTVKEEKSIIFDSASEKLVKQQGS